MMTTSSFDLFIQFFFLFWSKCKQMCLLIHNYHVDPTYSYIHHTHIHMKTFLNLAWQDTHTHTDCLTAIILECVCTNQQVAWSSSFDDDDDNNHNWLFKSLKNMLTFRRFFFLCDLSTEIEFTWVIIIIIIIDCVLNLFWCLIFLFLHYVNHHCFNLLLFFLLFSILQISSYNMTYLHTHTGVQTCSMYYVLFAILSCSRQRQSYGCNRWWRWWWPSQPWICTWINDDS